MSSLGAATRIPHPHTPKVYALLGHDHALLYWVEIHGLYRQPHNYDAITNGYHAEQPLLGALRFLSERGFYTQPQLEHALTYRQIGGRKPQSKGALVALSAIAALKLAADPWGTGQLRYRDEEGGKPTPCSS